MKICFVAGGSGGHITPALAVADFMRKQSSGGEMFFISTGTDLEHDIYAAHPVQYRRETIAAAKLRRYFSWQNIVDLFRFPKSLWQSFVILQREKPGVVFSKGGFVALPVGVVAKLLRIPLVIHESDTQAGLANRLLQKIATKTLTAFPQSFGEYVGTPIRDIVVKGATEKGRHFLGFQNEKKILLIIGGSQGAETINQLVLHSLDTLRQHYNIVHIMGKKKSSAAISANYKAFSYIGKEFGDVLAAADIVVSRAGANSLFEFAAAQKACVLLPLPSAANNHQETNAAFFERQGAAVVLNERQLTSAQFQKTVIGLLADTKQRELLQKNIAALASPDALEKIANAIRSSIDL